MRGLVEEQGKKNLQQVVSSYLGTPDLLIYKPWLGTTVEQMPKVIHLQEAICVKGIERAELLSFATVLLHSL